MALDRDSRIEPSELLDHLVDLSNEDSRFVAFMVQCCSLYHSAIPQPADAHSFSDSRRCPSDPALPEREVSINGQVLRTENLEWFDELRSEFRSAEVKYSDFEKKFKLFNRNVQRRVRAGLRRVRIHIVDSLAYQARENQAYRNALQTDPNVRLIRDRAREGNREAKEFLRLKEQRVAHDVLWDSQSERLKRSLQRSNPYGYGLFLRDGDYEFHEPLDVRPHLKSNASPVRMATRYVSQEASVFSESREAADSYGIFANNYEAQQRVGEMLRRAQAFDKGEAVDLIDERRQRFIRRELLIDETGVGKLYEVRSESSPHIQVADIAAGVAWAAYDRNHIKQVTEEFDYVTLNGETLTEQNLDDNVRYWAKILDEEKAHQKWLNS